MKVILSSALKVHVHVIEDLVLMIVLKRKLKANCMHENEMHEHRDHDDFLVFLNMYV